VAVRVLVAVGGLTGLVAVEGLAVLTSLLDEGLSRPGGDGRGLLEMALQLVVTYLVFVVDLVVDLNSWVWS
jgi:hypothetical protein